MVSLEQACGQAADAAETVLKSAKNVVSKVGALSKAAKNGNLSGIKGCQDKLNEALSLLQYEVENANANWPFQIEDAKRWFGDQYVEELKSAADEKGLTIHERDGVLFCYPSLVRLLPAECAVRIDRKKVSTVRPSFLSGLLLANQKKSSGFNSRRFLESLYVVYSDLTNQKSPSLLSEGVGRVVPLIRIYKLMTALPGAAREYDRFDFARDLYLLDSNGPRTTKKGAVVSFPSSTGARRRSSDLFSFIGPAGDSVEYYGIRFTSDKP